MQVQTHVKNGRNLRDGTTPHQCSNNSNSSSSSANNYNPNKKYHGQSRRQEQEEEVSSIQAVTVENGPLQIAALAEQVKELKETVNILISQITMLRGELKKK
jgi:hypothetical protein